MKKVYFIISLILLSSKILFGQNIVNVLTKDGKIAVQLENGTVKPLNLAGENSLIAFSRKNNFIVYKRLIKKSTVVNEEGAEIFDQITVFSFDLTTGKESSLFTTCLDGRGGTIPSYAKTDHYPFDYLCGLEQTILSPNGERLYFQTSGWATCPAIHYYSFKYNSLVLYMPGWLQKVTSEGVEVQITGIETKNNQGQIESLGRYTQYCLYDDNGELIRTLSEKE